MTRGADEHRRTRDRSRKQQALVLRQRKADFEEGYLVLTRPLSLLHFDIIQRISFLSPQVQYTTKLKLSKPIGNIELLLCFEWIKLHLV